MEIAIYSRKSIYSDKSDSVENQINLCTEYAKSHYTNINSITVYEDEGYTGANTDRPGFTRLIEDVKFGKVDILICYRIDRVSRNVSDFSRTFEILQSNGVEFVSLREQIDTSTPLGRAMMYICSVFSQMERETIAERIRDNSIELAKSGKWPGGQAPLGYKREKIVVSGKIHTTLVKNEEELPFLNMIYDKFLEVGTLSGLETLFRNNGVKTLKGNFLSTSQIHSILTNPHCVAATPEIYDYFKNKGCMMVSEKSEYDGSHGLIVYGRTNGGKKSTHSKNPPDKWRVAIGLHLPLISAEKWLSVQDRFGRNKIDKTRKHQFGLLKGLVRCKCGYKLRVQHKVSKTYNKTYDNYFCSRRGTTNDKQCDMKMVHVEEIDTLLLDFLKDVSVDRAILDNHIKKSPVVESVYRDKKVVTNEIKSVEKKISNLMTSLQDASVSSAAKYIVAEIEKLDKQIVGLNFELREISFREQEQVKTTEFLDTVYDKICHTLKIFDSLTYFEKCDFFQDIISECVWDGVELHVSF